MLKFPEFKQSAESCVFNGNDFIFSIIINVPDEDAHGIVGKVKHALNHALIGQFEIIDCPSGVFSVFPYLSPIYTVQPQIIEFVEHHGYLRSVVHGISESKAPHIGPLSGHEFISSFVSGILPDQFKDFFVKGAFDPLFLAEQDAAPVRRFNNPEVPITFFDNFSKGLAVEFEHERSDRFSKWVQSGNKYFRISVAVDIRHINTDKFVIRSFSDGF